MPQLFPPPHHPQHLETALEAVRRQHLGFTPKWAALPGFARDAPPLPHPLNISACHQPGSTRDGAQPSPPDTAEAPWHTGIPQHSTSCAGAEPHRAPRNPKLCRAEGLPGTVHAGMPGTLPPPPLHGGAPSLSPQQPSSLWQPLRQLLPSPPSSPQTLLSSPLLNPAWLWACPHMPRETARTHTCVHAGAHAPLARTRRARPPRW